MNLQTKYLCVIGPQALIHDKVAKGKLTEDEAELLLNEAKLRLDDDDWNVIRDYRDQCKRDTYWATNQGLIQPATPYVNTYQPL